MLTCENIRLISYDKVLVNNLSVSLLPSSITYLQGYNGSGKTTILRILAGLVKPSKGRIMINGVDINDIIKPYSVYIGHQLAIKRNLTTLEMLNHFANHFRNKESIDAAIYYLGLYDILYEKCENLSHGNLKKLSLSRLILCNCNLWLLDEVETNLDFHNLKLLHQLIISKANNGGIIIMTSHQESSFKTSQTINLADL